MKFRVAIIVPIALKSAADQAAASAALGIDPEALLSTMAVSLSANGDSPATHCACCGQLTDDQIAYLASNIADWPGAMFWNWNDIGEPLLVASSVGDGDPNLGESWGWQQSLSSAELKVIVPSLIHA